MPIYAHIYHATQKYVRLNKMQLGVLYESLSKYGIVLYFITNFINRDISSVFLILTLLICLLNIKNVFCILREKKSVVISIILFTSWILLSSKINNVPANEIDNYLRPFLLLPLLSIRFTSKDLIFIVILSFILSTLHYLFIFNEIGNIRYGGTSSSPITYANLLVIIIVLGIHNLTYLKSKLAYSLHISMLIVLFIIFIDTGTRGPLLALLSAILVYGYYKYTKTHVAFFLLTFSALLLFVPNKTVDRIYEMHQTDSYEINNIKQGSLRERVAYLEFGYNNVLKSFFFGIGPQNVETQLQEFLTRNNYKDINARDHLHNEFIDLCIKYGFFSLVLFLLIMFTLQRTSDNNVLILTIITALLVSQLTQSHFSHHQAITFFISLIYILHGSKEGICKAR